MNRTCLSYYTSLVCAGVLAVTLTACRTSPAPQSGTPMATTTAAAPVAERPTIRVKAGTDKDLKDTKGTVWKADTGFVGGLTINRPNLKVSGTDIPEIYQSEHYSMSSWSTKVPNGKYTLKLHFSEDYEGITNEKGRVFTYTVKNGDAVNGTVVKEVKGFSPWTAAKAQYKAYVDSVPVDVTNGQITVVFTADVENPQINAIEVAPQ